MNLKLCSWNVNGIRAIVKKGFFDFVAAVEPDILCLQETKATPEQISIVELPEYEQYWCSATKKGYSGTAIFTKVKPLSVRQGIDIPEHDQEGRVLTLEFPHAFVVTVYTPNAQEGLRRHVYRTQFWDREFLNYLKTLEKQKPVIFCGDLNVAHKPIDLANPKSNEKTAGFTPEERASFDKLIENGFIDTFRHFNQEGGNYTWWNYRTFARDRNKGWRIDYFLVSQALRGLLVDAKIHADIMGSDHCPVSLTIKRSALV